MSNEAGPDQPKDQQPPVADTDLSTPNQDLLLNIQEHVHNTAPRTQARSTEAEITVEGLGKLIGRDKTPVLSADVFKLAAIGMKDVEIAEWHGVDANTLRYHFSVQLLKGRLTLNQSLRRKQIEVAMGGNPTMLIFLGKNLLGQSDSPLSTTEKLPLPWDDNQ